MILDDIVAKKKEILQKQNYQFDMMTFTKRVQNISTKSFKQALKKKGLSIIGEIKKASPSKGLIKPDFDPIVLAKEYEKAVDCISVLTEEHFFQGKAEYLKMVHKTVSLPLLRKDFIISPFQIFEAKELGASCILLIVAILDEKTLSDFLTLTHQLNMDAIVEIHNREELRTALRVGADMIGINNRNLSDFTENIRTTVELRKYIPKNIVVVSESSIHTEKDIKILKKANVDAILVGESFMKCEDICKKAREFKRVYEGKN